jgi:glycosyltransferase 2 family protein
VAGREIEAEMPRWLVTTLKVAVTAFILALFARQIDVRATARTLSTISPYAIFAAVVVVLGLSLAAAGRLVMVVARFGPRFGVGDSYRVTLESLFFSQTFISFLGGDALRVWRIRRLGLGISKATSAVVFDRLIGTLINHIFLLATLPWFLGSAASRSVKVILVVIAAAGGVGFGLVLLLGYMRGRVVIPDRMPLRIRSGLAAAFAAETSALVHAILMNHRRLAWIIVLSSLITLANMLIFLLILSGMGVALSLAVGCALLVPAVVEISMLPISLAGWGVREGAAVVAFGALGLPADQALGASIAFGLTVAAVSMLGGVLWLVDRRGMTQAAMHPDDG